MNGASSSSTDQARSDAMIEGTRMLIDSLREKVANLEDRCEKMDREKARLDVSDVVHFVEFCLFCAAWRCFV